MSVVGYPTPGKDKARMLLEAFCIPAGGRLVNKIPDRLEPGPAAFYGVTPATRHLWQQVRREGREFYYIDNAYFDSCRERYFRITRNRLQHRGSGRSSGARLARLGDRFQLKPWRETGRHVLVCPQSDEFMQVVAEYPGRWVDDVLRELRAATEREIRVRPWNRDKKKWYATLPEDLKDCHAVVTYSSASALTAIFAGVPAFVTADDCIARAGAGTELGAIERPFVEVDRLELASIAADNQWTVDEMRSGLAWRSVAPANVTA